ncbi:unnamed protein product [Danaus chrysippus]|uniref:(African queen) hypothetical protein n=1 Tax=Danaus chrysippus TaxID=151541 RepID=A0A8J2W2Z4_9NEOP|nr:unnamed protein product [Danaus chrysippus]
MERLTLYEEYRLIERAEAEVNGVWKGAHLLLFFLAFVFGSFCTFCFHMLMYLFDEKCVLFPKLLSLTSLRQTIIYEFIPDDKEAADRLPVEFLSTQWVEKSACLLPTYVPLVSGIFGLVWTTMFLMCSTGSRVLTGLQRPWRVLPPVFLFSLAMGGLCIYTTAVTHYGLRELCLKLSEITGSTTCTYTVNVATLAYERRIRGVYQATRLTIYSAWLHTACWILSALLAFVRVIFAIDFKLVKVTVQLKGNLDRMLERQETHIRTISPEPEFKNAPLEYKSSTVIHFKKKDFQANHDSVRDIKEYSKRDEQEDSGDLLFYSSLVQDKSERSLLPPSQGRLDYLRAHDNLTEDEQSVFEILDNILDNVIHRAESSLSYIRSLESRTTSEELSPTRQYGQQTLRSRIPEGSIEPSRSNQDEAIETAEHVKKVLLEGLGDKLTTKRDESIVKDNESDKTLVPHTELTSEKEDKKHFVPEEAEPGPSKAPVLKSSLKRAGVQTEKTLSVQIDSKTGIFTPKSSQSRLDVKKVDKEVQTIKDKQD